MGHKHYIRTGVVQRLWQICSKTGRKKKNFSGGRSDINIVLSKQSRRTLQEDLKNPENASQTQTKGSTTTGERGVEGPPCRTSFISFWSHGHRQWFQSCPPIRTKANEISQAKHRISDHRVTSSSVILLCLSLLSQTVSVLSPNVQYIPFLWVM